MSGTSKIIGARVAAGIWRRSCPRTCIGQCVGVGAVPGRFVTGLVRMPAPGCRTRSRRSGRRNRVGAMPQASGLARLALRSIGRPRKQAPEIVERSETTAVSSEPCGGAASRRSLAARESDRRGRRRRRRVDVPGASDRERGNRRLRVAERIEAMVRTKAGAATGAAAASAAVTSAGRPAQAWRRDDAIERRRSRARIASPYETMAVCR